MWSPPCQRAGPRLLAGQVTRGSALSTRSFPGFHMEEFLGRVELLRLEDGSISGRVTLTGQNTIEFNGHDFEEILEQVANFLEENFVESQ